MKWRKQMFSRRRYRELSESIYELPKTSASFQTSLSALAREQRSSFRLAMSVYVSAGATAPLASWLDALRPGAGAILLVTRIAKEQFNARFISSATFIPCIGARDETTAKKLIEAFSRGDWTKVRSLHRGTTPDETCWCSGDGWWLSTAQNN